MTVTGVETSEPLIQEWLPPSHKETLSDWISDRGKYFSEAIAVIANDLSLIAKVDAVNASNERVKATKQGRDQDAIKWRGICRRSKDSSDYLFGIYTGMNTCKKLLAFPAVIKGSMTFYEHLQEGGHLLRNLVGDVCYIIGDSIDSLQGFMGLVEKVIPKVVATPLDYIKNITGIIGLGNTAYNLTSDLAKLRQIDLWHSGHKDIKDVQEGLKLKRLIVESEINNKWYDRLRVVSAVAACVFALAGNFMLVSAVCFAAVNTVGVFGKYLMYVHKVQGQFYQTRYAELLPGNVTAKTLPLRNAPLQHNRPTAVQ